MQNMGDGVMSLDRAATVYIDGDAYSFAGFGRATFRDGGAMNKNLGPLLCVQYAKLAHFAAIVPGYVQGTMVADLSAHLGVTSCAIENDVKLFRLLPG